VRKLAIIACGCLASLLVLPSSTVHAVAGWVYPFVTPPGSMVDVQVRECAAGTTTVVIAISPVGGAAVLDQSAPANVDGNARFAVRLPVDLTPGPHQVTVACMDDQATTIDSAVIPFEVAVLPVSVSPSSGPPGTTVTISGSGCPASANVVVAKIAGASDDPPVYDQSWTGPAGSPNADGSFVLTQQVPLTAPSGQNQVIVFCVLAGFPPLPLAGPGFAVFNVTDGANEGNGGNGGTIPKTGTSAAAVTAAACVVLATGVGLIALSHRRRHAASAARSR
jgi:hypothetical protein